MKQITPNPQDVAKYRAAARLALTTTDVAWRDLAWDTCISLESRIGRNRARSIEAAIRRQIRREQTN